jgi:hypothetical protein
MRLSFLLLTKMIRSGRSRRISKSYRAISVLMIYAALGTAAKRIAQTCARKIVGDLLI